jgi:hypothetical protein
MSTRPGLDRRDKCCRLKCRGCLARASLLFIPSSLLLTPRSVQGHRRQAQPHPGRAPGSRLPSTIAPHTHIHTATMAQVNWRTINIDALDPESSENFDLSTLTPAVQPVSSQDVQALSQQVRQLWRGGDAEGALRGALENAPYGADAQSKDSYMQTVTEVLQQVRNADMAPLLQRIYTSEGGSELCDVLMKYL